MLIIQLFRKSKKRENSSKKSETQSKYARKSSEGEDTPPPISQDKPKTKKKSKTFPWWCKIIAYALSLVIIGVSLFFIIVQGINLGDDQVKKWLTSFLTSIISSIFLTQPVKIVLTAFVFILICRKSNDNNDLPQQYQEEDNDELFERKKRMNTGLKIENLRVIYLFNHFFVNFSLFFYV